MLPTDDQWQIIAPLFPPPSSMARSRGRPALDDRRVLEAILWKLSTNAPWYDLPVGFPSHQTCYRRYRQWTRSGLVSRVLSALLHDLSARGGLDLFQALQNGSITLHFKNRRMFYRCPDHLRGTWQLNTALVFLGIAEKGLRQRPA